MSYDIYLKDPVTNETIEFDTPHQMRVGTYQLGGCTEAWLNVTYNYSKYYYDATEGDDRFFGILKDDNGVSKFQQPRNLGIRGIYGKTGAESIRMLHDMICRIEPMPDEKCDNPEVTGYWKPTANNAIKPLYQLIAMAQMRPDGVWDGD